MRKRFVVHPRACQPKEDEHTYITLRVRRSLVENFEELAQKSGHSRNKLMNMAMAYALEYLEYDEAPQESK